MSGLNMAFEVVVAVVAAAGGSSCGLMMVFKQSLDSDFKRNFIAGSMDRLACFEFTTSH